MKCELTCVILAGGLGTRLRPVLTDTPKCMAPVRGQPFLEYLLAQARQAGCTDVVLCVGYQSEVVERYFGDGQNYGIEIRYSRERELLGTAGALALARDLIRSDPFWVMNGDSYCTVDIEALIEQHQIHHAIATIVAIEVEDRSQCGSIVLGANDEILHFCEKGQTHKAGYVNAGIYVLNQAIFERVPTNMCCSIEHEIFPSLVGYGLYAFKQPGSFIDIGTPASFQIAQTVLPKLC